MNRLEAMVAFVQVADLRGFAPAARRLGLSPSVITRQVAGLEDHLGIRLFERTTRSVSLTDAGERYLERVRRILAELDEAEASAQAERRAPTGRFVVAAPLLFGRLHVAPLLGEYVRRHAAVAVELTLADRPVHLVDEGVDVAVRIGTLADSSLRAKKVGETRRVIVASPAYLRRRGTPRAPTELPAHDLVHFTGLDWGVPVSPRFACNSADVVLARVEAGDGLGMLMGYQAAAGIAAGRLRTVLVEHEPPPAPIQLVHPAGRFVSAKLRAFVELVEEKARWTFVDLGSGLREPRR
jgi:DNA-binding transcriptional LysR family regulator